MQEVRGLNKKGIPMYERYCSFVILFWKREYSVLQAAPLLTIWPPKSRHTAAEPNKHSQSSRITDMEGHPDTVDTADHLLCPYIAAADASATSKMNAVCPVFIPARHP